uniref:Uncharacterized protein n=1 Tax=Trichobilharzia regenti TaxID=157069 RepID=A0AA85KCD1_TRIRE|nr:unnamed protein product [Trichobilharzia regenti]CAH8850974.1 unnamed protein product [Trichobilharzia regenti]
MVSQRSKLHLIMIVGLFILSMMRIRSQSFFLPMTLGPNDEVTVKFDKINFTLDKQHNLTVEDVKCTYKVQFGTSLTEEELATKSGKRLGSKDCKMMQPTSH